MKSISVRYFALFQEVAGRDIETLEVDCATYADLYSLLAKRYGFRLPSEMVQVAVDDEFSMMTSDVRDGAKVVFIPPVAGG